MWGVALLAGMLGPITTRAERADPLAMVQTQAFTISTNLASYLGLRTEGARQVETRPALADLRLDGAVHELRVLGALGLDEAQA